MTNHPGAQSHDNQAVIIELPNGSTEKIAVRDKLDLTVRDLKVTCELQFGIPCNLQQLCALESPGQELSDWSPLKETIQTIGDVVIVVQVPVWWNKFICVSLNNEIENVCIRAKLPMQQISKEERLFVAFFIACCRGHEKLLERLQTLDIEFDHHGATEAGRNLFHAAAASGNVNCVEFVAKHLIKPTKEILTMLDTNRETPIDIARRLNHHDAERLLYKYMYNEKGARHERNSTESGIDLSEECRSEESDDSSEEKQAQEENISALEAPHTSKSASSGETKIVALENEELVITECDEGLSFSGESRSQKEPPPNPVKSQTGAGNYSPQQVQRTSPCSSESSDESCRISPRLNRPQTLNVQSNQHLLQRRFKEVDPRRPKSARTVRYPKIHLDEEEVDENDNHLPPLEVQTRLNHAPGNTLSLAASPLQQRRLKQAVVRTNNNPNTPPSKQLLSTSNETPGPEEMITKSAPGSPQSPRRSFKPSMKAFNAGSISPVSPQMARVLANRRGSEPLAALGGTNGIRFPRSRREAIITGDLHGESKAQVNSPIMFRRSKARSICEVSLADSLREHRCFKDMDEEERLDRPWNAWIAVRKESLQPMNQESAPDPNNPRRMSFQQWISEKELNHLRNLFANAQEEAKTNEKQAKLLKGKSFEEWMEDKQRELEREKEREKDIESQQKLEQDKKYHRRRMSQAEYSKWLMQKERDALLMEEKKEQLAKQQHELMKKKWEEQDELKKNCKQTVGRTQSLPVEERAVPRPGLNKHRFKTVK